jgi:hypothetical protein
MREREEGKEEEVTLSERTMLVVEMVAFSSPPRVITPLLAAPLPLCVPPRALVRTSTVFTASCSPLHLKHQARVEWLPIVQGFMLSRKPKHTTEFVVQIQ